MRHRGLTLIELLVVIAIIGILLAILLPAVQAARESARRVECCNHLKQFALAASHHHDANGFFPSGGWGVFWTGDPDRGFGLRQPGGWVFSCLPYLEQQTLFQIGLGTKGPAKLAASAQINTTPIAVLYCPSRRAAKNYPMVVFGGYAGYNCANLTESSRLDYAINCGDAGSNNVSVAAYTLEEGDDPNYPWPSNANVTGVSYQRSQIRARDIRDGMSCTYLIGEKYVDPANYLTGVDTGDDQPAYIGYDNDGFRLAALNAPPIQDTRGVVDANSFGSAHAVALNMSFCDGSVRLVNYSIDVEIHRRLGNRRDGRAANLPP